ncbi:MAG: LamB/YcsF family protein [Aeromicrobium sp.]|nr:MAG: LamB/YcsF family protein [Aeromicrobium sp.]
MTRILDLNVDMGESIDGWLHGTDQDLLLLASSVNVCTGAYAGTTELITETCQVAVASGVRIGAQVGYRDRAGFGRRPRDMSTTQLHDEIAEQLDTISHIAKRVGGAITYVKPHGALYHRVHHDPIQAEGLLGAVIEHNPDLAIMGMPDALTLALAAERGLGTITEGFADRGYTPDGLLVARDQPGALLDSPDAAAAQALQLATRIDSLCVHSDSPDALELITRVRSTLEAHGYLVQARA